MLSKYYNVTGRIVGQVERQVSPYHQHIFRPLFKNAGTKLWRKVTENVWDVAPSLIVGAGAYLYTVQVNKQLEEESRF